MYIAEASIIVLSRMVRGETTDQTQTGEVATVEEVAWEAMVEVAEEEEEEAVVGEE